MNDFRNSLRMGALALVCSLGFAGCSSEVAISPQGAPIASSSYNFVTGDRTLSGDVKGDLMTVFHATNRALDSMPGYLRVMENISKKDDLFVYARGPMDVLVTVEISTSKTAGMNTLSVSLDNGNQPATQAIYAAILNQVNNPSGPEAPLGSRR